MNTNQSISVQLQFLMFCCYIDLASISVKVIKVPFPKCCVEKSTAIGACANRREITCGFV